MKYMPLGVMIVRSGNPFSPSIRNFKHSQRLALQYFTNFRSMSHSLVIFDIFLTQSLLRLSDIQRTNLELVS